MDQGNESLFDTSRSNDQDGHEIPIYEKKNLFKHYAALGAWAQ